MDIFAVCELVRLAADWFASPRPWDREGSYS